MTRKTTIHTAPSPISEFAPPEAIRLAFASRLQNAMIAKGWNQSELARRATEVSKSGPITRDVVSVYIRAKSLPGPDNLASLAAALGMERSELLPSRGITAAVSAAPPAEVRDLGEGKVWIRINQEADWPTALEILGLLKGKQ